MRTKLLQLVLAAVFWWAPNARAQAETNAPPTGRADRVAALAQTLGASTNVEIQVTLTSESQVQQVIELLTNQAGLKVQYAPELLVDGKPGPLLTAPAAAGKYEQVTAFDALLRWLPQNGLVIGQAANNPAVIIGKRDSNLTPLLPAGGDLDEGEEESGFGVFASPTTEIPLETAIIMLSKFAKLKVYIDPQLKEGTDIPVGTNFITIPSIKTNMVTLSTMEGATPKQQLMHVLEVHHLEMKLNPASQIYTVKVKDPGAKEPMVPNVIQLRYSNTTNISELLTNTFPTARIRADTRTASLLVLSTQSDYQDMTNLVTQLDTPTKQVLIEARFLETLQNPRSIKGIDWTDTLAANRISFGNGTLSGDPGAPTPFTIETQGRTTTTQPTTTPNGRPGPSVTTTVSGGSRSQVATYDPASPGFSLSTAGGFTPATAFLNSQGVNAVLSFLNSEADTRTLATPRAVTLDNMPTTLSVTRAVPIFAVGETVGAQGALTTSSQPTYTNLGTILVVTPRVSDTNVSMKVEPELSRVEAEPARKVVAGRVNEADIFAFTKIETHVTVPSGNTLVMGGLMSDSTTKSFTKVPLLGDIPILGWAFRRESRDRSKANLIIFLTPTIIAAEDFQPYRTEFLNTQMPEHPKVDEGPMTSGKPAVIGRKAKAKAQAEAEADKIQ